MGCPVVRAAVGWNDPTKEHADAPVPSAAGLFHPRVRAAGLREYVAVREATTLLFESLPPDALDRSGTANERPITVRALGWVIAGHSNHHANILLERYLSTAGAGIRTPGA